MTDETKTGGPAFPHVGDGVKTDIFGNETGAGMTLRDYFAGQALSGLCGGFTGVKGDAEWFEQIGSNAAYKIADSMIEARSKQ